VVAGTKAVHFLTAGGRETRHYANVSCPDAAGLGAAAGQSMGAHSFRLREYSRQLTPEQLKAQRRESRREVDLCRLCSHSDPIRADVPAALAGCREAGIA